METELIGTNVKPGKTLRCLLTLPPSEGANADIHVRVFGRLTYCNDVEWEDPVWIPSDVQNSFLIFDSVEFCVGSAVPLIEKKSHFLISFRLPPLLLPSHNGALCQHSYFMNIRVYFTSSETESSLCVPFCVSSPLSVVGEFPSFLGMSRTFELCNADGSLLDGVGRPIYHTAIDGASSEEVNGYENANEYISQAAMNVVDNLQMTPRIVDVTFGDKKVFQLKIQKSVFFPGSSFDCVIDFTDCNNMLKLMRSQITVSLVVSEHLHSASGNISSSSESVNSTKLYTENSIQSPCRLVVPPGIPAGLRCEHVEVTHSVMFSIEMESGEAQWATPIRVVRRDTDYAA